MEAPYADSELRLSPGTFAYPTPCLVGTLHAKSCCYLSKPWPLVRGVQAAWWPGFGPPGAES